MSYRRPARLPVDLQWVPEACFLGILIWLLSAPLSGAVLSVSNYISGLVVNSISTIEATKHLAAKLMQSSRRVRTLEGQLADTKLELARLLEESKDVENLRALLGLHRRLDYRTIAASVVVHNPDNWFERITIDKGSIHGIEVGSAVITNNGIVGQVNSVSSTASVVRLLTDPDQNVGILIPRINQPGVLAGRGHSPPVIEYVSVEAAVDVGDRIVSLGNGGAFPSGHPVGVVSAVRRDVNGTTLSIEVRPAENYYDLTDVLVIPPKS